MNDSSLKEVVETVAKALVDHPEEVTVTRDRWGRDRRSRTASRGPGSRQGHREAGPHRSRNENIAAGRGDEIEKAIRA